MSSTVIGLAGTVLNKRNKNLCPHRAYILVREANKQNIDIKYIVC